tara:strand:+ start:1846 stop:2517 length:672 start_codon:yes stop_codon:yes gene_type:complete
MSKILFTYFTIELHLGTQKDYSTFLKAENHSEAVEVLQKYCSRKFNPLNKIKYVRVYEIKKGGKFKNRLVDDDLWFSLIAGSYPNDQDSLIMNEIERKSEHRWNIPKIRKINNGFKAGKENWAYKNMKGKSLPNEERRNVRYDGKWKEISEEEVLAEQEMLKKALESCNGNKSKAAKFLNLNRNTFYKRLKRHPDVDWGCLIKEIKKNTHNNDNSNSRQPPGV